MPANYLNNSSRLSIDFQTPWAQNKDAEESI